jgi:Na+-driven multidrug efflux pump
LRIDAPYRVHIRQIRFHKASLVQIIRYGLPSGIQNSVIALANVVVQSNINSFGKAAMAGCGAYSKLEGFAFLPVTCFTQALSTFVGQNLGAKQYHRAKQGAIFGTCCSVVIAEIIGFILYAAAPVLIRLFDDTPQVIAFGTLHTRTIARFFFLLAFSHCAAAILRGSGRPGVPMLVMLLFWCILRVSYITIAVQYVNELTTVSWAYPITWTCSSIVLLIYLLRADWLHNFDRI